jgi:hypothetical protein
MSMDHGGPESEAAAPALEPEHHPGSGCGHADSEAPPPLISPQRLHRHREPDRKRTLLIVPPFCSPNYTYPAPAYLARLLKRRGYPVAQADLNLELLLRLFSKAGLARVFAAATPRAPSLSPESRRVLALRDRYLATIEPVISSKQHALSLAML